LIKFKSENKDIEDVRGLIQEAKEIKKLAPPIIAFRASATTTTTAAQPVIFREVAYNYGNGYSEGVFRAPLKGLYSFYAQMRSNVKYIIFCIYGKHYV